MSFIQLVIIDPTAAPNIINDRLSLGLLPLHQKDHDSMSDERFFFQQYPSKANKDKNSSTTHPFATEPSGLLLFLTYDFSLMRKRF